MYWNNTIHKQHKSSAFFFHDRQKHSLTPREISTTGQTVVWLYPPYLSTCWFPHKCTIRKKFPQHSEDLVLQALSAFSLISLDVRMDLMCPGITAPGGQRTGLQRVPLTPAGAFIDTHSRRFAMETPPIHIPTVPQKVKCGANTNLSHMQTKPSLLHCYYLLSWSPSTSFSSFSYRPGHAKVSNTFTIKSPRWFKLRLSLGLNRGT